MSDKTSAIFSIRVSPEQAGQRLDSWLATLDIISSRSRGADLIERGLVTLQGKTLRRSYRVQAQNLIQIALPPPAVTDLKPLNAPLDLLFEDDDLLVVNKPAGLVVHPAAGHAQDTLVNILLYHVEKLSMGFAENRPGIVHRLDRDTSGVLVVAKNDFAHHSLAGQFRSKTVHRIYWALVYGTPRSKISAIRSHLARHPNDRKRFASNPEGHGKYAVTHYRVLQSLPSGISWLQCQLETGRTHQIRVHLSELGFPILGDRVYSGKARRLSGKIAPQVKALGRVALHACELGFVHPRSSEKMFFQVGWPVELLQLARALGFADV